MTKLVSIILAGGASRRLYPIASALVPKQFMDTAREGCLFQNTMKTVSSIGRDIIVISSIRYRNNVLMQLNNEQRDSIKFIFEPCSRNNLAAIISGSALAIEKYGDPLVLVTPCDLVYEDQAELQSALKEISRKFNDNSVTYLSDVKSASDLEFFGAFVVRASKLLAACQQFQGANFATVVKSLKHALVRQNEISINYEDYSAVVDIEFSREIFSGKLTINNFLLNKSVVDINNFDDFFNYYQSNGTVPLNAQVKELDIKNYNRLSQTYYIERSDAGLVLRQKSDAKVEVA